MKKILFFMTSVLAIIMLAGCGSAKTTTTESPESKLNLNSNYRSYYQIFVRSFADSDGDGVGDIKGITANLEYLEDLGVEGLWLMPFCEAVSYHGYDVTDYYKVDEDYGTNEDMKELLTEAHKRGIKVIMDFVINHTSEHHEWFQKAKAGEKPYVDYYVFANSSDKRVTDSKSKDYWYSGGPDGKRFYGYFSGTMPDLNYANSEVRAEIVNIANFWADLGMDGYRIDGALHICGVGEYSDGSTVKSSIMYLNLLRSKIESYFSSINREKPYFVAEVYDESASQSMNYYECVDSTFDFWLAKTINNSLGSSSGMNYAKRIQEKLGKYENKAGEGLTAIDAPFLTNHDQDRIASKPNITDNQLRLAAEMLLTLQGNPFIYYGEEIGMKGVSSEGVNKVWDETRRLPFIWGDNSEYQTTWFEDVYKIKDTYNTDTIPVSEQKNNPDSLYNTYKTLLNLRKNNIALKYGDFVAIDTRDVSALAAFTRTFTQDDYTSSVLVIHNFESKNTSIEALKSIYGESFEVLYYSLGEFTGTEMAGKTTLIIKLGSAQ